MVDLIVDIMKPQFLVMLLASVATFVTVLTIAMPALQKDRMGQRMKVMATERDKMRAQRIADLAKDSGGSRLRQAPKGFMQQIVDQFNLRSMFESEELKNKLKMAGLRGQAPLVTYMVFRIIAPVIVAIVALIYVFAVANLQYPPIVKFGMAIGAGYMGFYLPNMIIENLVQRRQASISQAFPDALDMLLICVQDGRSRPSRSSSPRSSAGRRPSCPICRTAAAHSRISPSGRGCRASSRLRRHSSRLSDTARPSGRLCASWPRRTATHACRKPRKRQPHCRRSSPCR